ncbi:hypothetical protein [Pseudoalteromonas sp. MMG012]|uniref:hypothetical protein n=1 Tax=Pseudoalteromonas sp. MMG012 TaxID=2822686 RepID=UPI001B3A1351|nr:hypothetical protein [Pseudoalteromonas sp. MMG012]MBQ4851956.1 hypothetical protein [Pseudoalteromonas sp. MMG012]
MPDGIPGGARRRFRIPAGAILARVTTERTKHDGAPATYDVIENLSSDDTGHARVDGGWRDGKWEIDHLHNDA